MKLSGFAIAATAACVATSSLPSRAAELLTNGSFEESKGGKVVGWSLPKYYRYEMRGGMNGTRGIAFENEGDKEFYAYPSQAVPFESGKRYEFSIWAKAEGLTKNVGLCIEWFDADGKWLSGSYAGQGTAGTYDWRKLTCATPPIPSETKKVRIAFLVQKGGFGKAWFDDISVRPLERPVFGGLYSSAYRNLSADGKVRFHAAVNLKDHVGTQVRFQYKDAGGTMRSVKPTRLTENAVLFEIEAAYLAKGTHPVSCELIDRNGQKIGGGSIDFTRVNELPKRRTWFDSKRRAIVDGKPFFPLGIYLSEITDRGHQFQNFLTGPFNCTMPYVAPTRAQLDKCRAAGIEVIYPLHTVWSFSPSQSRPKGIVTDADADAYVEKVVAEFKDHPALLAWYCNDERPPERIPQLLARQQLLERIDPGHPTWTVLYQYGEVRSYYPSFDVIGTDPYPVPQASIGNVAMWTRTTDDEVMGLKPIWQVPQAFAWEDYGKKGHRFPTREEMVNMTWQCVANGANGIVYFAYRLLYKKGKFMVDRWADICAAAASVKPYIPVILSDEESPQVTGATEDLSVRAWRYQGAVYLAVVNNTRKPVKGEIGLDADSKGLSVLQGAADCTLKDPRTVSVSLDGLSVAFLRLGLD